MMDWLHRRGITPEVISLFNVTIHDHPQMGECIRIPYTSEHAKYRRDPNSQAKPKYLYDAGGKVTLYGADKLLQHFCPHQEMKSLYVNARAICNMPKDTVVITEGELDTLVLWSANIPAVSSTGGAMSFQEEWAETLAPYNVYICFDNDDAGAKGMVKVLKHLPNASVILVPEIPDVKDISDYVSKGFDFRDLMKSALHNISVESISEDIGKRKGQMQSTRFHQAYLDAMQQELHKSTYTAPSYDGDDRVLKAKSYPMGNLIDFNRNFACCPWHSDSTPSLKYYPKTNSAYCFGSCGKAYDAIDAYMLVHGVGFKDAVKDLNDKV